MTSPNPLPLADLKRLQPSDYVLVGGVILSGADFTPAEAVRITDGVITAIGSAASVAAAGVPQFDLGGATALPGLHDTHFHMMSTGANRRSVDLFPCVTVSEVIKKIGEAEPVEGTDWLIAGQLDESRLAEHRAPTLAELDAAFPDRPVYVNDRGLHYSLVNSVAAELLDIVEEAKAGDGRMQEDLSGLAKERLGRVLPLSYAQANLRFAAKYAADHGLTKIHALEGGELFDDADVAILDDLRQELPVRVHLMWSSEEIEKIHAAGYKHAGGDVCADGSIGSHTARLTESYSDAPGERGVMLRDVDYLTTLFQKATDAGIQFGVHAIGDVGVRSAVEAIKRVCPAGNPLRHRIEHFGMPTAEDIATAAELQIGISTQPGFAFLRGQSGGVYESRLGPARLAKAYPLRTLLDSGIVVSGGSDSDVTPVDPFLGIHSAVNHPQVSERVTPAEALTMYTGSAEWMAGGDPRDAYLIEGTRADLTIATENPLACDPEGIIDIAAVATIVGGVSTGR